MNSRRPAPSRRARRGVTIIELLVAMTLLTIGLLSIAGISSTVSRSLGESREESLAAMAAQSRFEQFAGTACTSLTLGSVTTTQSRGITEKYAVTSGANFTLELVDTVSWKTPKRTRQQVFKTILPCRPGA